MKARHSFATVLVAVIVAAAPGCDNVDLGRADVQIVYPPPAGGSDGAGSGRGRQGLPSGSVLFHVVREEGGRNRLIPIAEVLAGELRELRRPGEVSPQAYQQRFRETVLEPGSQFALFAAGSRVGTLQVNGHGPATRCGVPTATGTVNTVAAAADELELLAFREGLAPELRGDYSPPEIGGRIRTYTAIVAERLILQHGLPRPRSWAGAQRDLQAVELDGGGSAEMAATYLSGDQLAPGAGDERGYSVFYLASYDSRAGYTPFYSEVHSYAEEGKAAPRMVDHLDIFGDDREGVILQLYGEEGSWYGAVAPGEGGRWSRIWEGGRC
ncbi:MAG: hypothetical protein ACREKN_04170 [Longimicrobiaceae bacterium]